MDFEKGAQGGALQLLDTRGNDLDVNASRFGLSTPNSKHVLASPILKPEYLSYNVRYAL